MDASRAAHWQEAWAGAGLARARAVPGHGKFFALVAYPGTSGFLHVGHLRGYAYLDSLHRYHRMLGEEVLFPFGVHASGLPAVTFAQKVRDRDPALAEQLDERGIDAATRARIEDPEEAARFLGRGYLADLRRLGCLVDERTFLTTVDEDYRAFIGWQFRALKAAGALVQGTYFASVCPVCGPVAVDPSETDLSSGGDAEVIRYTTVPFRLEDGRTLLAATLRPETVYGVTNLWVAPGEELVVWHLGEREYLVARPGAERLVEQHGGHLGHAVPAADLVGRRVSVPLKGGEVPVLEGRLVEPAVGTGVVMSVPAHAPADAMGLRGLDAHSRESLGVPPVLIGLDGSALTTSEEALTLGEGTPAERALRATAASGAEDLPAIQEATERLYRLELVRGRMAVGPLAGIAVREARERAGADLRDQDGGLELQEFSKPVICRNGHTVVIRRVPDQWFLHYSDPAWKAATKGAVGQMEVLPPEYRRELPAVLDWFQDRPCIRRGRWLGTPFPFDPAWMIEPIADSTLYMAYFVVRRFVAEGRIDFGSLTDPFFDFVFRGQGPGEPRVDPALQDEVRSEFLYWYPLDLNIGGKEHKRVHFPVFAYTHALLLPPELRPRGIFAHGWTTGASGAKISKKDISSKSGRIPPLSQAMDGWGADALRLYYLLSASPSQDVEFDPVGVDACVARIEEVGRLVREAKGDGEGAQELDTWLESVTHTWVARAHEAFRTLDLRAAAELLYVEVPSLLRRYYTRGGEAGAATDRFARTWVRFLSPITPHLAEEVNPDRGLVAAARLPPADDFTHSNAAEAVEAYLDRVEEDLRAVLRVGPQSGSGAAHEVIFYVASAWKSQVEQWIREGLEGGSAPPIREVMRRAGEHAELAAYRSEIPKYVERVGPLMRSEPRTPPVTVDEVTALRSAEGYLVRRFGFGSVQVLAESEAASHDPKGRRERSRPGRPAFYVVGRRVE